MFEDKIISFDELSSLRERHPGSKIVHCHGVFDLFHYGHLIHLKSAKAFGDILVVTLTPDCYVNKGPNRPYYSDDQRALVLAAQEIVDYVTINRTPKAIEPIAALRPHFYVKGPDYRDRQKDITGGIYEEEDAVNAAGGELVFTDDDTESATTLINKFFSVWDEKQTQAVEAVKSVASTDSIIEMVDSLASQKVLVVGEPIIDTYVFCQAQGISSKSPTVSARYLSQEDYTGGSLAIANHLKALGCEVTLLISHGGEPFFVELLKQSLLEGIQLEEVVLPDVPTPRKTRYIVPFQAQKVFELTDIHDDQWFRHDPAPFAGRMTDLAAEHDVAILADFGHGLFEGPVLEAVKTLDCFVSLNVQTNSANFGFNPFTKHDHYDYISIDERECRLGMHDRHTAIEDLAKKAVQDRIKLPASITLGTQGSLYFDKQGEHLCPIFFKDVIDTTGSGDAYFAITTLLSHIGAPGPAVPFIGNCFAGLKARIIGNKEPVSKVDLVRTLKSILN